MAFQHLPSSSTSFNNIASSSAHDENNNNNHHPPRDANNNNGSTSSLLSSFPSPPLPPPLPLTRPPRLLPQSSVSTAIDDPLRIDPNIPIMIRSSTNDTSSVPPSSSTSGDTLNLNQPTDSPIPPSTRTAPNTALPPSSTSSSSSSSGHSRGGSIPLVGVGSSRDSWSKVHRQRAFDAVGAQVKSSHYEPSPSSTMEELDPTTITGGGTGEGFASISSNVPSTSAPPNEEGQHAIGISSVTASGSGSESGDGSAMGSKKKKKKRGGGGVSLKPRPLPPPLSSVNTTQSQRAKRTCCCFAVLFFAALGVAIGMGIWVYQLKHQADTKPAPTPTPSNLDAIAKMVDSVRNKSADPCNDFYEYACGQWIADNTPIPDDQVRLSRSFTVIMEKNLEVLKKVNDEDWPVIGSFYKSCMDTDTINNLGHAPLAEIMDTISRIGDKSTVMYVAGDLLARYGVGSFFGLNVIVDSKNPAKNILNIGQGGLTLPDRDLYFDNDTKNGYLEHLTNMWTIWQDPAPSAVSQEIIDFETAIAEFTLPLDELRDPEKIYHKYNWTTLQQLVDLSWSNFFNTSRIPTDTLDANVEVPNFFVKMKALIDASSLEKLKNYLRWRVLHASAPKLSKDVADETFRFFNGVLSGQKVAAPRWKTCSEYTDGLLGDILGRYFVERAFPGQSLNMTQKLIKLVEAAIGARFLEIDWMDTATKEAAQQKLSMIVDLVGYPSKWTDYSSVPISSGKFFENIFNLQQFGWSATLKILTSPVDKTRWQMTPPTVNAYYDPSYNTINFPAGIIQPTFFDATYPMAMNFGGIGMVMGHEVSHGFDDQGRQYDGTGMLKPWWSQHSIDEFSTRAKCLVDQYSQFKIGEDHVNGNLTLGENIADNGGIRFAFNAYQQWVKDNGAEPTLPLTNPITNNQLFFLAFAQGWCTITRDAAAKQRLKTDVHSPPFARVLGPLRNFDEFSKAWKCPAGSPMNPEKKCLMW